MKKNSFKIVVMIIILLFAAFRDRSEAKDPALIFSSCCIGTIALVIIPFSTASAAYYANRGDLEFNNYYWWTLLGAEVGSIMGVAAWMALWDVFMKPGETSDYEGVIGYSAMILTSLAGAFAAYKLKYMYDDKHSGGSSSSNFFTLGFKTNF